MVFFKSTTCPAKCKLQKAVGGDVKWMWLLREGEKQKNESVKMKIGLSGKGLKMRYVASYLLALLGGNDNPSINDLKKILESVGIELDKERAEKVVSELKGKKIDDVIAQGKVNDTDVCKDGAELCSLLTTVQMLMSISDSGIYICRCSCTRASICSPQYDCGEPTEGPIDAN
ncbi:unnamed protein product [Ranitomeya imitator]|uniref:Large ribosomal subunit protein P2 n=1 Tax=Ranitomeya imitator TaxID=111125 RepID=A0ABN9MK15_9NEOB|nr:unnamed protein product [Ranitomeya imitator]